MCHFMEVGYHFGAVWGMRVLVVDPTPCYTTRPEQGWVGSKEFPTAHSTQCVLMNGLRTGWVLNSVYCLLGALSTPRYMYILRDKPFLQVFVAEVAARRHYLPLNLAQTNPEP